MSVYPSTSQKNIKGVKRLAKLFEKGQVSDSTAQTLTKLVNLEADKLRLQLAEIQRVMADYERQYALTSVDFYKKYQAGETDDRMDYVEWAGLTQMAANLREQIRQLTSEQPA